jgi:1-pyrroline-5-carboxylate dehydrogenase
MTLFTGSNAVGEHLVKALKGKVRLEDGGFDWKLLGPDIPKKQEDLDFVAYTCDQDAYAVSGQKCSCQSIMFMHRNWRKTALLDKMKAQAAKRNVKNLTAASILTWDNKKIQAHQDALLELKGAEVIFGGKPLKGHNIPDCYGAWEPTAIFVPLSHFKSAKKRKLLTTELFGPFQIVTEYTNAQLNTVLDVMDSIPDNLTAAIVSNDQQWTDHILGETINGTQYAGLRARTTGAPQNHWFGPSGDPRGAGIGTDYAIQYTWSHHREVVTDVGPVLSGWKMPPPS